MNKTIWINARFIDRPTTGVERVAREVLQQLSERLLDQDGCLKVNNIHYHFKLVAPSSSQAHSPWANLKLVKAGRLSGHLWEQLNLPLLTGGDWLISLCNTGPLLKRNHCLFLHDAQPFAIPDNFSFAFRAWYKVLFRVAGKCAKRILVNSKFTQAELEKHAHIDSKKITLCYLGGDHVLRQPVDETVLQRFDLPDTAFVLAVSSLNPNKNISLVAKALENLGEHSPDCVVVGTSGHGHFSSISLDSKKIHILGYVSDAELLALYQRAACLVFPSFYEGFGLPILEAMTLNCPVISSRTTSMMEIGADAIEYCDPRDASTLSQAIQRVISSVDTQASLKNRGKQRSNDFAWKNTCDSMVAALSAELQA